MDCVWFWATWLSHWCSDLYPSLIFYLASVILQTKIIYLQSTLVSLESFHWFKQHIVSPWLTNNPNMLSSLQIKICTPIGNHCPMLLDHWVATKGGATKKWISAWALQPAGYSKCMGVTSQVLHVTLQITFSIAIINVEHLIAKNIHFKDFVQQKLHLVPVNIN